MKKYLRYILKDLVKLMPKLLAIVLIVILGVGFTLGLLTSAPTMRYSLEKYYEEKNAADIIVQAYNGFDLEDVNEFKVNELIQDAYAYFNVDEIVEFRNGNYLANIMLFDYEDTNLVNKLELIEGRLPNPDSENIEIVVERTQPFLIDVPLGYVTSFLGQKVEVVGIVQNPWYFAYVQEISQIEQRPIEVIIYASVELLPEVTYTHIAATLKNAYKYDTFSEEYEDFVSEKIDLLKLNYTEHYFATRNLNQSFAKYKSDVKIVEAIALIFPMFFLLITILVTMSSITRIVEDQRSQIGTLKSLGYSNFKIMLKYIIYSTLASGIGIVIGIGFGIYFIPSIVYNAYKTIYNLPPFRIMYHFAISSFISFSILFSVLVVTILNLATRLREKTTELLKVKSPKPGKKILLEKMPWFWNKLKFKYKSTFRNIFRHKRNLFLTIVGISGSTALLLAGFAIKGSVVRAGEYQYEEMMNYDMEISISDDTPLLSEINDFEKVFILATNAQYNNKDYIGVIIPKDLELINKFLIFKNTDGSNFNFKSDSVIITKQFADKHDILVGDLIDLKLFNETISFKVTNIQEYYFGNQIYISNDLIPKSDQISYNKIYLKTGLDMETEKKELETKLIKNDSVVQVLFEEDIKYSYLKTSESMNSVIVVLVLSASALAIIINYNLTLINIHTRKKEMATLKVLGYLELEVSGYVFRETLIISTMAILIGLLFGKTLHYFIISQVVVDGVILSAEINWLSYIYTLGLSFVFLAIVYLISIPQIRKINMIDALKSYE